MGRVGHEHGLDGVEEPEVGSTVDDDTLDGDPEASVEADEAVSAVSLYEAVGQAVELAFCRVRRHVSPQPEDV